RALLISCASSSGPGTQPPCCRSYGARCARSMRRWPSSKRPRSKPTCARASVGLHGILAYAVTQRTREIGIRMALGAQRGDVLRLILREGVALVAVGLALGLVASLAATSLIERFLYGVRATDPLTYALIALVLAAVALLACYLQARRATKVDPMVALRYE